MQPAAQDAPRLARATNTLQKVRAEIAPDSHLILYRLGLESRGSLLVLTGNVSSAEAKTRTLQALREAKLQVDDQTSVLPSADLGVATWGICTLSTANGREGPEHKAELGTQILMGQVVRILKQAEHWSLDWFLVQSADGYFSWHQTGNFVRCTSREAQAWSTGPLLVITNFETQVRTGPQPDAAPVCDLVLLNLVKRIGVDSDGYRIQLPDGREGYIGRNCAAEYCQWKSSRRATAENIERSARQFLGRPYLWGGNSPRGLDCSGLTKIVFALNGIDLRRNASQQAQQGIPVSLDGDFRHLKKGDLLFFGRRAEGSRPEKVTHVGIYLGNKTFIHSAEWVRISSLDPASPERDVRHSSRLLHARRVLPESG